MKPSNKIQKHYKVIFLDWSGTLSASKFWGHLEDIKHPHNGLFKKIEDSLFGNLRHLIKPWMRGEYKSEGIIEQIAIDSGLSQEIILQEFIIGCKQMKLVSDEIIDLINKIKKTGTKVVIATDNMDSFTRWTVPVLKLDTLFDDILNSYNIKAMKEELNESGKNLFFSDYLIKNKIDFGESVLIDDSEDKEGRIAKIGIEYRKIEPVIGLIPELQTILTASYSSTISHTG